MFPPKAPHPPTPLLRGYQSTAFSLPKRLFYPTKRDLSAHKSTAFIGQKWAYISLKSANPFCYNHLQNSSKFAFFGPKVFNFEINHAATAFCKINSEPFTPPKRAAPSPITFFSKLAFAFFII